MWAKPDYPTHRKLWWGNAALPAIPPQGGETRTPKAMLARVPETRGLPFTLLHPVYKLMRHGYEHAILLHGRNPSVGVRIRLLFYTRRKPVRPPNSISESTPA